MNYLFSKFKNCTITHLAGLLFSNDKILDWTMLEASADNKKEKKILVTGISFFSHNVFQVFLTRVVKTWDCGVKN